jgi:nucleotide-binding universal stress UspA family protein
MSRVVAAVDDSDATGPVLASARALAIRLGASVDAVHVGDDPSQSLVRLATSYDVALRTLAGDPLPVLAGIAVEDDVVALTIGVRGTPGGPHPAGHLAIALADCIEKPVVVVPPDAHPGPELHRVVIAIEGRPRRGRTLMRAVDLTSTAGLELVVVHVDDETSIPLFSDQVQHETESYSREFLARYAQRAPDPRLELRIGLPADEILTAVDTEHADMLAIGWPPSDDPARGVVAREILDRCHTPMLLVAVS